MLFLDLDDFKAVNDSLGHGAGDTLLVSVAEGIEQPEQAERLRALGCVGGQGYYFARPLTAERLTDLLSQPRAGLIPLAPTA